MSFYLIFAAGITLGFLGGVIATLALIWMYESSTWEDEGPYHRL